MSKPCAISLALLVCVAVPTLAQSSQAGIEQTFQVPATSNWTDTGLDLKAGDTVRITASSASASGGQACDAKGNGAASSDVPLPTAPAGALIARLNAGETPVPVGSSADLHIDKASHLFLGINASAPLPCQGGFSVKVQLAPNAAAAPASAGATAQQQTRGTQLKSQLSGAAQVFMQGQFGMGKPAVAGSDATSSAAQPEAGAVTSAVPLEISKEPLDGDLRKGIDALPRRVNDQFNNLGDMVNFVIVGDQKDVQDALSAADWHVADTNNERAMLNAVMQTYDKKDYLAMPMSTLYLFGRKQDFGYEMAEPIAMVASRHHFRIWKAPFTYQGHEVWCGAGTHDIGFAKDRRNNNVTHKIDPSVDGERDNIGGSLQKSKKVKTLAYYLPPSPVQDAKNATGDGYRSDGRLLVVFLQ
ncbi:MAG TPA: LssY C-terminal domain-containing protein [Candidatus Sulfotelmatobacter sp.]|jgi:hypothetical protein